MIAGLALNSIQIVVLYCCSTSEEERILKTQTREEVALGLVLYLTLPSESVLTSDPDESIGPQQKWLNLLFGQLSLCSAPAIFFFPKYWVVPWVTEGAKW